MDVLSLLEQAEVAGLTVRMVGDRLVVRGPKRAEALARQLCTRKTEILRHLRLTARVGDVDLLRRLEALAPSELAAWRASWGQRASRGEPHEPARWRALVDVRILFGHWHHGPTDLLERLEPSDN
jgi:hypothetical protein